MDCSIGHFGTDKRTCRKSNQAKNDTERRETWKRGVGLVMKLKVFQCGYLRVSAKKLINMGLVLAKGFGT